MGGPGSGRWTRWGGRDTIEEYRSLSIRDIKRLGYLEGNCGVLRWTVGGEETGSVRIEGGDAWITLNYRYSSYWHEPEQVRQSIGIEWTPCHFGGHRPWFECPGCKRRCGVLVGAGKQFLCRKCYDLPYASQNESAPDRAIRKLRKIQKRLGNPEWENVLDIWLPRPKGMHRKTYERILEQAEQPITVIEAQDAKFGLLDIAQLI